MLWAYDVAGAAGVWAVLLPGLLLTVLFALYKIAAADR